jgi:tetratricopeptide (TPR) repeat protein
MSWSRDPRPRIGAGILLLVSCGLVVRTLWGPGPLDGARVNQAQRDTIAGRYEDAYAELHAVALNRPNDMGALLREGRALRDLGRLEEARTSLEAAAERGPREALVFYELARVQAMSGDYAGSLASLDRTLEIKPKHADAMYSKSAVLAAQGDVMASIEWLEKAWARGPSDPERARWDPLFDPIRQDPRFTAALREHFSPHAFRKKAS